MADSHADSEAGPADTDPRPAAVTFVTTEHFTLQGARSSTIAEATGRATMFLGAVSGGLVALGLIATATDVGAAFYAFGLLLLPMLAFVGLVTFDRVLQSGIEDYGYAQRIARLRGYYFKYAPELVGYLLSVPPAERLRIQGMHGGRWQRFLTVAGMVGVITAVLAGSAAGLLAAIAADHSLMPHWEWARWSPSPHWPGCCAISGRRGSRSGRRRCSPTKKQGHGEPPAIATP